ncbi:34-kDa subunit of RNA polymerase III (C) [Xanthoria calcicola]
MLEKMDIDPPNSESGSSRTEIKNALYARCASLSAETVFSQHDLLDLGVIPDKDIKLLLQCTQELTREGLFKLLTRDGRACWRVVKKEDAEKYKSLTAEESLVYSYVESAGREGIWNRMLRIRSGLHMTVVGEAVKSLERRNYIKQIKTAKFPNRKTYMLAGLQPSDVVTGGPFYTDGTLDDEFVHQMSRWTERYIVGRSWAKPPDNPHIHSNSKKSSKQPRTSKHQIESKRQLSSLPSRSANHMDLLPFPPGFIGYPTVSEITRAINASNLSPVTMKEAEMKQLLDILVWDGRIEENLLNGGYKAVKKAAIAVMNGQRTNEGQTNEGTEPGDGGASALTEAPCGRCPVIGFCEEGGPVNARSCEYFTDWLMI